MSANNNWGGFADLSHPNWTGRAQRTSDWGGCYAPNSHRIPPLALAGAAAVVALLFFVLPHIGAAAGF